MIGALCGAIIVAQPRPALAAGLFDFLFGGPRDRPAARAGSNSDASTRAQYSPETVHDHGIGGRTVAFCVRLCDGEGFPIAHLANATPIETCRAMCPASKTEVFFGSQIDGAVARDGTRYGQLENAFLFRKHLVANCTCNGRDQFGLAPLNIADDATLRPGDIVVTQKGLMAFSGRGEQGAAYTPVDPSSVMNQLNSVTSPQAPRTELAGDAPGIMVEPSNAPPRFLSPVADLRGQVDR
ncbi:MAG: DUF2865 domain-containing protein [Xanthobacteraceae bacterium]